MAASGVPGLVKLTASFAGSMQRGGWQRCARSRSTARNSMAGSRCSDCIQPFAEWLAALRRNAIVHVGWHGSIILRKRTEKIARRNSA